MSGVRILDIRDFAMGAVPADIFPEKPRPQTGRDGGEKSKSISLTASPFTWQEPTSLAPREWIYGHHLIRKYVSATIAPGATGKSALTIVDALAMVSGQRLLADKPHERLRVWAWNGEDPRDEIVRRVVAVAMHFGLKRDDIGDRLFLDSGRDMPITIGETANGAARIAQPMVDALIAEIKARKIDVLVIDPFVSAHRLAENDNGAMDAAVKAFALVADRTGCAIELVHHTRKLNGTDADIDAARGGSSLAGAVRAARALNPMSADAAKGFGIDERARRSFVRIDNAKANLAPPGSATWFQLVSVDLGNATQDRPADHVGVPTPWTPPDAFDGLTVADLERVQREISGKGHRESSQAADWVGHAIGSVLDIDVGSGEGKERIKKLLKGWIGSGALRTESVRDGRTGRNVKTVEVGDWACSTP